MAGSRGLDFAVPEECQPQPLRAGFPATPAAARPDQVQRHGHALVEFRPPGYSEEDDEVLMELPEQQNTVQIVRPSMLRVTAPVSPSMSPFRDDAKSSTIVDDEDLLSVTPPAPPKQLTPFFLSACCITQLAPRVTEVAGRTNVCGATVSNTSPPAHATTYASSGSRHDAVWIVVSKTWIRSEIAHGSNRIFPLEVGDTVRVTAIVRAELRTISPAMGWVSLVGPDGAPLVQVSPPKSKPAESYAAVDFGEAFLSALYELNLSAADAVSKDLVMARAVRTCHAAAARHALTRVLGSTPFSDHTINMWGSICERLDRAIWGPPEGPSMGLQRAIIRGDATAAWEMVKNVRAGSPLPGNDPFSSLPPRHVGMVEELLARAWQSCSRKPEARNLALSWEAVLRAATRCQDQGVQRLRIPALRTPERVAVFVMLQNACPTRIAAGAYEYAGVREGRPYYSRTTQGVISRTVVIAWRSVGEWWISEDGATTPLFRGDGGWLPPAGRWELGTAEDVLVDCCFATVSLEERIPSAEAPPGCILACGTNTSGQLGVDNDSSSGRIWWNGRVVQAMLPHGAHMLDVACSESHCIAVDLDGRLFSWGNNEFNQLGCGHPSKSSTAHAAKGQTSDAGAGTAASAGFRLPALVNVADKLRRLPRGRLGGVAAPQLVAVACGAQFSIALDSNGFVWSWGCGEGGVLGLGRKGLEGRDVPTCVESTGRLQCRSIACGAYHSAAVGRNGELFTWGRAEGGQLGLADAQVESHITELCLNDTCVCKPCLVTFPPSDETPSSDTIEVQQVSCGDVHSCALDSTGRIWSWGWGEFGQLGLGFAGDTFEPGHGGSASKRPTPSMIPSRFRVFGKQGAVWSIACGGAFSCAVVLEQSVDAAGVVFAWGSNEHGQCAQPAKNPIVVPTPSMIEGLSMIISVACGAAHAVAVDSNGCAHAWGQWRQGQLGASGPWMQPSPPLRALSTATDVGTEPVEASPLSTWSASIFGSSSPSCVHSPTAEPQQRGSAAGTNDTSTRISAATSVMGSMSHQPTMLRSIKGIHVRRAACGLHHTLLLAGVPAPPNAALLRPGSKSSSPQPQGENGTLSDASPRDEFGDSTCSV
eukprot:TRINITY_DN17791_c0_g1_i1.p1 TRINITY_DN17791_c0_g1~~TRINITY_DN17791_c0_g1_i1.p1  ORF type:complete len:1124 (+),score=129.20 TRINITY_DN17791_c0_g1_i1:67-3372(+)